MNGPATGAEQTPVSEKEQLKEYVRGIQRLEYTSVLFADSARQKVVLPMDDPSTIRLQCAVGVMNGDYESPETIATTPMDMSERAKLWVDMASIASGNKLLKGKYVPYFLQLAGTALQYASQPKDLQTAIWVSRLQQSHGVNSAPILDCIDFAISHLSPSGRKEQAQKRMVELARGVFDGAAPHHIGDDTKDAYRGLFSVDEEIVRSLAPEASSLLYLYAKEHGIQAAIRECKKVRILESRVNAYIGVSIFAAETEDSNFLSVIDVIKSELADVPSIIQYDSTAYLSMRNAYRNAFLSWLEDPDIIHILDFGKTYFSESWIHNDIVSHANYVNEQAVSMYYVRQYIEVLSQRDTDVDRAKVETFQQWFQIQEDEINVDLPSIVNESVDNDDAIQLLGNALSLLVHAQSEKIDLSRVSEAIVSAILKNGEEWWPATVGDTIENLVYTESPLVINALLPCIKDTKIQTDIRGKLLILYGTYMQPEYSRQIWDAALEQEIASLQDPMDLEVLGWHANVLHQKFLEKLNVPLKSKIAYLIGLSHRKDWKQRAITLAVQLIKRTSDIESLEYFDLHNQEHFVPDKFILDKTFELMDYKKTDNYMVSSRITPQMIAGVHMLLRMNNEKGKTLAIQLFSNVTFGRGYPEERARLLHELIDLNVVSKRLIDEMAKHATGFQIGEDQIEFIAEVYRRYGIICSETLFTLIFQQGETFDYSSALNKLEKIYKLGDSMLLVQNSIERCLSLVQMELGAESYYMSRGDLTYLTINDHPLVTWKQLLARTASLALDPGKLDEFNNHLIATHFSQSERQTIINRLLDGLYPFETNELTSSFVNTHSESAETLLFEIQDIVQRRIWGFRQLERTLEVNSISPEDIDAMIFSNDYYDIDDAASIDPQIFDFTKPYSISELETWATSRYDRRWSDALYTLAATMIEHQDHPYIQQCLRDLAGRINDLIVNEQSEYQSNQDDADTVIEFIQKGENICRFAWASGAVQECVAADKGESHVSYMSRRVADPFSWTIDIFDKKIQKVIGSCEMWLALNPKTQRMEVCGVGIYSGNKTKELTREVMKYLEFKIARPLKLGAINMAQAYGGVIRTPIGYTSVDNVPLVAFSPVVQADGSQAYFRGDDILHAHNLNAYQNGRFTYNEDFLFKGLRKEMQYNT